MSGRILVVEDERELAELLCEALRRHGFDCEAAFDGDSAVYMACELRPDLIVLDVMLPGIDGFEVTRRLKNARETAQIPIILLTARREEEDVLAGFAAGASDYVRKPFSVAELVARIGALIGRGVPGYSKKEIVAGDISLDADTEEASLRGKPLDLSATEYKLLEALALASGRTVSRDELLRRVWGMKIGDTRTLDVHIFRLRRKIEADPEKPSILLTAHGRGYKLVRQSGENAL